LDLEPFFGYSSMKYKTDLNEWIEQRKKDHFSDLPSEKNIQLLI
jgi:hypothetical protein